ncbi:fungal specific transcription factor domain-containing protein [Ophiostoma piceae UAMH 11346]|uniref:Fungal specific transcription factor domain-containing protein n=1 Tax=Ophiostoma piceae (strain UAMH 11346) TaxID=1262450 RepID=S3BXE5_OPHP1|nr:fungal specific transcription factor domain-containing protein [Ophiostoma piceae UAMH 11346]
MKTKQTQDSSALPDTTTAQSTPANSVGSYTTPAGGRPSPHGFEYGTAQPQLAENILSVQGTSPHFTSRIVTDVLAVGTRIQAEEDEDNAHIVGPVETNDARVLADYLSAEPMTSWRSARSRANAQQPVMFTCIKKRPIGVPAAQTTRYFTKVNTCLPLLDKPSFLQLYEEDRLKISPALLSGLYANSLIYWGSSTKLATVKCPDARFIWNRANESLYSELHISPGISTIIAILLNVGGRPTTSIMGNSTQLGSAVSLAYSLGLNRDPCDWDIPAHEKSMRIRIWWALVIHDKWQQQYDVPRPSFKVAAGSTPRGNNVVYSIYVALVSLTDLLDTYLGHVYDLKASTASVASADAIIRRFVNVIGEWESTLDEDLRRIVLRGNNLHHAGAANLRLAYLTIKLLHHRIELDLLKTTATGYVAVQKAAEDIVFLVQELTPEQLGDFWLPTSAFALTSAATSLLRCALDADVPSTAISQSTSVVLANQLLETLRAHRDDYGWDVADICIAQYGSLVQKLSVSDAVAPLDLDRMQDFTMPDVPDVDQMFPSMWDVFTNYGI